MQPNPPNNLTLLSTSFWKGHTVYREMLALRIHWKSGRWHLTALVTFCLYGVETAQTLIQQNHLKNGRHFWKRMVKIEEN